MCLSAPLLIQWKVTNKCNLRCKHCYVEAGMTNNEISKSEKDIIFNRILAAKPFSVLFTGGECFEEPSTIEYMRRAYHEGIDIRVFTNGTNLEYFFDDLIEMSDRLTINVSLDGMESEHDFIRGKGNFNKTINNISGLIERNIQPSINIVINKINYKSIIDLLELLKSIKVKNVQVSHLTIFGNAISNKRKLAMDEKMYSEFNFYLESYLSKNLKGLNVTYKSFNHEEDAIETNDGETYEDTWTCCAGISRITVDHLGDVYPCPFLKNEYKLGNIINNDLHFLWQDPNRIKFIENLKKNSKNGKCLYF
ncbi:radical SAM/SPASM domain-containing protein [Bacillus sp. MB2021]|uniref:radical SAM/SPASM domain-containing protein n=1 Tax=Bacillus sp. MB2021 TaxID=1408303 RepID=UPI0009DFF476